MSRTIAISRRLPPIVTDMLKPFGDVVVPATDSPPTRAELMELMREADGTLVTALDVIDAGVLAACPKLRVLANIGAGYDNIDVAAARTRGVTVTNTPGVADDTVADLAFGLIIGAARRLPQADAFVRSGHWTMANPAGFGLGLEVSRSTLGVVGFGRIGQAIAKRAGGFDMTVLYHSRRRVDGATEAALRAQPASLDELLRRSDFVVLAVPYSAETHHMVDSARLSQMKRTAVLVNVARGGVVDDGALAEALGNGTIAGAALDCYENEPVVHQALLGLPNVVHAPHIGSATAGARQAMIGLALRNLVTALQGGTPPNVVV